MTKCPFRMHAGHARSEETQVNPLMDNGQKTLLLRLRVKLPR